MRLSPLQLRVVTALLLVLALVGCAGSLVLWRVWLGRLTDQAGAALVAEATLVKQQLDERHQRLAQTARRVVADEGFSAAVGDANDAVAATVMERARTEGAAERLALLDNNQGVRLAVPLEPRPLRRLSLPNLAETVAQRTWLEHLAATESRAQGVWLWSAVALPGATEPLWMAVGTPLDAAFLGRLPVSPGRGVMVFSRPSDAGGVISIGLPDAGLAAELQNRWLAAREANLLPQGRAMRTAMDGHDYLIYALSLPLAGDTMPLQLLMVQAMQPLVEPYQVLLWTLLALTLGAMVVLAVGAALATDRLVQPLRRLAQSARRVAAGDYESPVEVRGSAELAELGRAFEGMRQAIRKRDGEIRRQAFRDALTGLPNRAQFREDLRKAIAQGQREGKPCAILLLDVDRFKVVNDVLGHRFGDRVLLLVAERLKHGALGTYEKLARLGGDEFAVLLHNAEQAAALTVARRLLRGFDQPMVLDEHRIDLGASIGIACFPAHSADADQLISRAEVAMYAAKREQAGTVVYRPELDSNSEETLSLLSELRRAIERDELRLVLQPKVDLRSGALVGAEALLRWQHPVRGMVPPMQFVPFAEQTGFVRVLTEWVLERGALTLAQLNQAGLNLRLSVNLSARDLADTQLPGRVAAVLRRHKVKAETLVLEITESAIMDDPERALQTLMKLHEMGIKLSIDDFGTGYSSLAYLKRLPVDELKIDKSFVMNMERDLQDAKIVHSTVDLAHNLGLQVVAEGIESAKAWKILRGLRCDQAQGYFIGKPMAADQLLRWAGGWVAPATDQEKLDSAFAEMLDSGY